MNMERIRVQLIEDNPGDARLVKEVLRNEPRIVIQTADRLSLAVEYLSSGQTDVIMLDLGLPDSQGLDALRVLSEAAPHVPIVVLTGHEDEALGRRIIGLGAQDYLVKPVLPGPMLARTLRFAIERKRAELALRSSEAKYRQLHESLMDGFVSVDMQGRIIASNSTYQKMLGYSEDELHSLTYLQITPERWHALEAKILAEQIIPRGYSEVYEKEYRCKNGEILPIELRTSLLRDESGAPTGMWAIVRDLTEQKRAEIALRASEARFRQLFNSAAVPLCFVDKEGVLADINDRFVKILGYTKEDVPTLKEWWRLACPNPDYRRWAAETWNASLQRAILENGDIDAIECRVACKNGDVRTLVISGLTIGDNFLATFFDITDRKQAEEALQTSEARLFNALKTALLGHWEYNVANDLFTFNDQFYSVMKTTAEREGGYCMTSKQYMDRFVHPDDRSMVNAQLRESFEPFHPHYVGWMEHRTVYPDGTFGYVSVRFFAVMDDQGHLITTNGVNQDVTERKHVEEALRKSEAQYRLIADNTADVIWLFDLASDQFTYISPSVKKLWGFDINEALHRKMQDALAPACYRMLTEALLRYIAAFKAGDDSARTQTYELEQLRRDGTIIATETVITLISDEQRNVSRIQGISRDITERKLLQQQLLQAQKMEAVGRLAGGIAHDFNNLLTIIIGYSDSLLSHLPRGDAAREELELIRRAGDRAAALTSKLLAFSRKQILQPKVIDLKSHIQESLKLLRRLIGEDIELITTLGPDLGWVKADITQIEQVTMNLAVNSRDAMPQGGKLILNATNVSLNKDFVNDHIGAHEGEYVMFSITDTGMGMDAETKTHLFEPFFTTKETGKGTGLGLATVYGIVTQSGGFITVDSELGQGTTFSVYLPRIDRGEEQVKPREMVPVNGSGTVLLVEDADDVRALASRFLQERGYAVLAAGDGPSAVRIAEQHAGTIHLLLTDMIMPGGMTGLDVAELLRKFHPDIRVIVITGYIGGLAMNGVLSPDIMVLQKPFTANDLLQLVHEALQEKKV
jgi:two-component system, cell cycle sensor histidine kinase and response regulator CckA